MGIDTSGGGWRRWASVFDGSDGQRWVLAFDGGDGRKLCQWWTIKTAFNGGGGGGVRWRWQSLMAFDGTAMDYGKAMARQRRLAQLEDERAAQGEATQQPAGTMIGQEGGTQISMPNQNDRLRLVKLQYSRDTVLKF